MIAISGFFADPTGYGEHARRAILALQAAGADVCVGHSLSDGGTPISSQSSIVARQTGLSEFLKNQKRPFDEHLVVAAACDFPVLVKAKGRQVGWTAWETDRLFPSCLSGASTVERLIVPSDQNHAVWLDAGIDTAIIHLPTVDVPIEADAGLLDVKPSTFIFYSMLTWQERKNPKGLLVSYLTAFTGYDDVLLILKVGGGAESQAKAERDLAELLVALNIPNPPHVRVISDRGWSEIQMWSLHLRGDCFVTMTRGEGFGLPVLDAMTAGSRIISSGWGGHTDMLVGPIPGASPYGITIVPTRLTPVVQPYAYFTGHQSWGDPDLIAARVAMQRVVEEPRGKIGYDLSDYDPKRIGSALEAVIHGD